MIISNPACSPFMLVCSEVNDGCSISFIDVVPRSSELRTLLPLIAFSPIRKFSSAQPPCSGINGAASVSCSGLLIHVTSLVLGTGCVDSTTENPSSARTSPSPFAASFNRIIQKSTASFKTTSRSVAVCSWRVQRSLMEVRHSPALPLFPSQARRGELCHAPRRQLRARSGQRDIQRNRLFKGMEFVLQNPGCSSLFATRITNCDSTTIAENYLIVDEDRLDSTLIPHPTQNAITSRILYNLLDEATATLQRFAESAVEGKLDTQSALSEVHIRRIHRRSFDSIINSFNIPLNMRPHPQQWSPYPNHLVLMVLSFTSPDRPSRASQPLSTQ
ncbi:hypothetical protein BLNAU_12769 [Blattamonas nauphoetae]|uniref:Uncharacterized protein n=1 Tax=Blattamonas nauphoetae TaxID=2049346 RepID=A0ABQ9XQ28_9EUKA|nr:hypothetical protein BLNAU_12769 [Blattamonas nauphoetae]